MGGNKGSQPQQTTGKREKNKQHFTTTRKNTQQAGSTKGKKGGQEGKGNTEGPNPDTQKSKQRKAEKNMHPASTGPPGRRGKAHPGIPWYTQVAIVDCRPTSFNLKFSSHMVCLCLAAFSCHVTFCSCRDFRTTVFCQFPRRQVTESR